MLCLIASGIVSNVIVDVAFLEKTSTSAIGRGGNWLGLILVNPTSQKHRG